MYYFHAFYMARHKTLHVNVASKEDVETVMLLVENSVTPLEAMG